MELEQCRGCGAKFPASGGATHPYMLSSAGCWATFGAVLAREYADPDLFAVHRLSVDAYAVQHPGLASSRPAMQSIGLHLARLTLQLERGLSAERANAAMVQLAEYKARFHWLEPPASLGAVTVAQVALSLDPLEHAAAVRVWARSALDAWQANGDTRVTIERWLAFAFVPLGNTHLE
jgi:Family of unknown function (DUF5946)